MLAAVTTAAPEINLRDELYFAELRAEEFGRLDAAGQAYLDYTGSALYAERQVRAHAALISRAILGNPHSENPASRESTRLIDNARAQVLRFLDAPPEDYAVIFTANASAAIKLVAESFPFGRDASLVLAADNHNSVNGIREYARRAGAPVHYLPLDSELRLDRPELHLASWHPRERGMFAFPAQSNFSGVQHPLGMVRQAQALGYTVLIDAAALVPTSPLSLRSVPADFVALSFYKVFGYPTGVGALVARRDALAKLNRPWFAGGTLEYASVQNDRHLLRPVGDGAFEDGTPAFLSIAALEGGFTLLDEVCIRRLNTHVMRLTAYLLDGLRGLKHPNGAPLVTIYGPPTTQDRGGTIAFNVVDRTGRAVPFSSVEARASGEGVSLRGGCFCNPGASEAAFGFRAEETGRCLDQLSKTGFSVERFAECLGPDIPVGAVRASIGIPTNEADIDRALSVLASYSSDARQARGLR
ncbi:MAG TPA: aminotransferase class V-fold PLP-dependent enzyme [Gemmatimonadaceae bacterium]